MHSKTSLFEILYSCISGFHLKLFQWIFLTIAIRSVVMVAAIKFTFLAVAKFYGKSTLYFSAAQCSGNPCTLMPIVRVCRA